MSNDGVVLIARNNGKFDYVKQAVYLAERIKKYLNLPTSIITDSPKYLKSQFSSKIFDKIISVDYTVDNNNKRSFDGSLYNTTIDFKNSQRSKAYQLSPYEKTLLMDTDYIICNDHLLKCFSSNADLMMFKKSIDLAGYRETAEFNRVSDFGIEFYWATVVYFTKCEQNEIFFNLIDHIKENWHFYQKRYFINESLFRNDYAFSIAAHIMNGFSYDNRFVSEIPVQHFYTLDRDILHSINGSSMTFLIQKEDHLGEYTLASTKDINVHVMNKFSLQRIINEEIDCD
jgi:hypothetical protein